MKRKKKEETIKPPIPPIAEMHRALDDIDKVEQACRKALNSGLYDEVQTTGLRFALDTCLSAKDTLMMNYNHVAGMLELIKQWNLEKLEDSPSELKEGDKALPAKQAKREP